jgi:predicted dehydrogenase
MLPRSTRPSRRQFLSAFGASVAGFGVLCQGRLGFAQDGTKPNDALQVAGIGVGGKGSSDITHAGKFGRVVALCDIDDNAVTGKAGEFPDAKRFVDYRELLESLGDTLDAVVVSTADHTHAPAAVRAMRMGKHVYCQKPLTHTVAEARLMRETARKYGVCTQMGNQGSATDGLRRGVEVVQSGGIGEVAVVHCWTNRPLHYWKQAPVITARPSGTFEVPGNLHWNEFLGTAPERPYAPVYTPSLWRGWWDFGTGCLGDMACHTTNLPIRALRLGLPTKVSAQSGEVNPETYPAWATITYEFPARDGLPPVTFIWYEGAKDGKRNLPPADLFPKGVEPSDSGSLMVGSKGLMYAPGDNGDHQNLWPSDRFEGFKDPEPTIPRIAHHGGDDENNKFEWFEAIRQGKPAVAYSNFDYAATQTEAMLLGNIAIRTGETIEYDGTAGRITNSSRASEHLAIVPRKGWEY